MKTNTNTKDVSKRETTDKFSIVPQWLISNESLSPIQFKICTFLIGTYQMKKGNKDYSIEEIARETAIDVRVVRKNMKSFLITTNILEKCGVKKDLTKSFKPYSLYKFNYSNLKKLCKIEEKPVKDLKTVTSDVEKVFESFANLLNQSDLINSDKIVKDLKTFVDGLVRGSNVGQEGREETKEEVIEENTDNIKVLSTENIESPTEGKNKSDTSRVQDSVGLGQQKKESNDNSLNGRATARKEDVMDTFNSLFGGPTINKPEDELDKNPNPSMAPGPEPDKDTNSSTVPESDYYEELKKGIPSVGDEMVKRTMVKTFLKKETRL